MSKSEVQMCLACNENPATSGGDTVPLCAKCRALANNPRGVTFEKTSVGDATHVA